MKAILPVALISIGALCFVAPMSAHARGSGGHNANSGSHAASQNQPAAARSTSMKTKGNKETYLKYELKDATVSSARAQKKGKVSIKSININKRMDKASP
jgi:type VI protein secretion system component Hcp